MSDTTRRIARFVATQANGHAFAIGNGVDAPICLAWQDGDHATMTIKRDGRSDLVVRGRVRVLGLIVATLAADPALLADAQATRDETVAALRLFGLPDETVMSRIAAWEWGSFIAQAASEWVAFDVDERGSVDEIGRCAIGAGAVLCLAAQKRGEAIDVVGKMLASETD